MKISVKNVYVILQVVSGFLLVSLASCTPSPENIGVTSSQWHTLSETQKQQMMAHYRRHQKQWRQKLVHVQDRTFPDIEVSIAGGAVQMPPFEQGLYAYRPVHFTISHGQCLEQLLVATQSSERTTKLSVCYSQGVLSLDDKRYGWSVPSSSALFYRSSLWGRPEGFVYPHVTTGGYVHLKDVQVTVHSSASKQQG